MSASDHGEGEELEFLPHEIVQTSWERWAKKKSSSRAGGRRAFGRRDDSVKIQPPSRPMRRSKSVDMSGGYFSESSPTSLFSNKFIAISEEKDNILDHPSENYSIDNRKSLSQPVAGSNTSALGASSSTPHYGRSFSTTALEGTVSDAVNDMFEDGTFDDLEENKDPNFQDDEGTQRERKKIRARQYWAADFASSLSSSTKLTAMTSFSDLANSTDCPNWLNQHHHQSSQLELCDPASPAMTVNSSRKRGVTGSPISDLDDWNSSSSLSAPFNQQYHRPCVDIITSPSKGLFAPELYIPERLIVEKDRGVMELDSDDAEEESHRGTSSHNASFESYDGSMGQPLVAVSTKEIIGEEQNVLETMSSYEDLKFLVKCLRKEQGGKSALASFGIGLSWTVAPPVAWTSSRRSAFFNWTTKHLGFCVRSAGAAVTYMQISKSRGLKVLEQLEAASATYTQRPKHDHPAEAMGTPVHHEQLFLAPLSNPKGGSTILRERNRERSTDFSGSRCLETENLIDDMGALSLKSNLVRHVTLDSSGPSVTELPRPSFDHHTNSKALVGTLYGESPVIRPASKLHRALSSDGEFCGHLNSAPSFDSYLEPIQSQEIIETPLMNDNGWGSCPVRGRDWGVSTRCDELSLDILRTKMEELCKSEGIRESFGASLSSVMSSNLVEELVLSATRPVASPSPQIIIADECPDDKVLKRKKVSLAKHKRMSLWVSAAQERSLPLRHHTSLFCDNETFDEDADEILAGQSRFSNDELGVAPEKEIRSLRLTDNELILANIFSYLDEAKLLTTASLVCSRWADAAAKAHACMMFSSVCRIDNGDDVDNVAGEAVFVPSVALSMSKPWRYLQSRFPWGCFLSEGSFKKVYKVHNTATNNIEAVSVMDIDSIVDKSTVAAELAVSALLSSLVRRGICPNFIQIHGVFTCAFEPASALWGTSQNKRPLGSSYDPSCRRPRMRTPPKSSIGNFQFIRMELCNEGDAEEFIKRQKDSIMDASIGRAVLFQIAFALYVAAEKFCVKHYDVKLLNIFLHRPSHHKGDTVVRYGLGSHMFALRMPPGNCLIAKLADYGTANIKAESNGRPVTIAQFTTLENTPPDYLILGNAAKQGHGHDCFGLGLCMLHLFTGQAPYEEILEQVKCPPILKKRLRKIWESDDVEQYSIIRSIILADVYTDEAGNILEGDPDDTLYDTLYRFLVLFGIPSEKFQQKQHPLVWNAITDCLEGPKKLQEQRVGRKKLSSDYARYSRDQRKYSIRSGSNKHIARARRTLESLQGGMELLLHLCAFDPLARATAAEVINSAFMKDCREPSGICYNAGEEVLSFTALSTSR